MDGGDSKEVARITLIPPVDVSKRIGIAKGLVPHSWVALGTNYGMVRYDRSITVNTTPIYAVTYREQDNGNVGRLVEWMLSEEGQYIIEETGYVGLER